MNKRVGSVRYNWKNRLEHALGLFQIYMEILSTLMKHKSFKLTFDMNQKLM